MFDSLQQCQALFDDMTQGVIFLEADGTPFQVNPAALEIFGLDRDQFMAHGPHQPRWRLISLDGLEIPPEQYPSTRALKSAQPVRDVTAGIYNSRRQSLAWVNITAIPVFCGGQQTPCRVCITLTDITEQKRMQDIHASRSHLMQFAQSHSLDELLVETLDEVERVTGSRSSFYHFYDIKRRRTSHSAWSTRTAAQGCPMQNLGHNYLLARAGVWADCIVHGQPVIHNDYHPQSHGKGMPEGHAEIFRALAVPVKRGGQTVALLGIANKAEPFSQADIGTVSLFADLAWDIAEHKRNERQEHEAARQYELLANTSMDGHWIINMEGRIVSVNDAACRMYGYSREEMIAKPLSDFEALESDQEMLNHTERIVEMRYERFETVHRRKDGSLIEVEVSTTFIPESGMFLAFLQDITSKKRAGRALQQSEKRYRAVVNSQMEFVDRYLPDGTLTFVNDALCNFLGAQPEELLGTSFYPFVHEEDRDEMLRSIEALSADHPFFHTENRVVLKDGSTRWHQWSHHALLDDEGNVSEYQSVGRDITERKQAEENLLKSEERYRSLFDSMLNGFAYCRMIFDADLPLDFVYLEVNRSFERLTGLKGAAGKRMSEVLPGISQSDPDLLAALGTVSRSGEPKQLEYFLSAINEWLSISLYSPEPDCFVAVFDVITNRKRIEECLAFLAQASVNATPGEGFFHRLARYLANSLDMDYICIDILEEGNLYARTLAVYFDGTFEDNVRYTLKDTPCGEVVDKSVCCFREGVRHLFPKDAVLQEMAAESYLGTVLWDSSGAPIGLIAAISRKPLANRELAEEILQMVSGRAAAELERGMHEDERLRLEQQLLHAQKLESLGILAGGIAHDFNNILTGILGNSSLAMLRIDPHSPVMENLQNIEKAAIRAADLAKQMLAYSGKGMFVVEPINLNQLLDEMIHLLEISVSKKAVLKLDLSDPLPTIQGDPTQLRQIVMNLVINASEAIEEQSGVITITTGCRHFDQHYLKDTWFDSAMSEGRYVYLQISDTGCGMGEQTLARIFDPFFTTKFTGRGLGMSAVLGIIRGHKGAIEVKSSPGCGTTFTILLPPCDLPLPMRETENSEEKWRGSGTVLLVDDEETICEIGAAMLEQMGYDVVVAHEGNTALELYQARGDITFVILDLTMPQLDGEQTFIGLRKLDPKVRVIMSSGYSEQEVTRKLTGLGLLDFIQKPYSMQALLQVMKRCDKSGSSAGAG